MKLFFQAIFLLGLITPQAEAALITVQSDVDLATFNDGGTVDGASGTVQSTFVLDPIVSVAVGDTVDLTFNFNNTGLDAALRMQGASTFYPWLRLGNLSQDSCNEFTVENITVELLGLTEGNQPSVPNSQTSACVHLGPGLNGAFGDVTFTGIRTTYDVASLDISPDDYPRSWLLFVADHYSVIDGVPAPGALLLLGIGLVGLAIRRRTV